LSGLPADRLLRRPLVAGAALLLALLVCASWALAAGAYPIGGGRVCEVLLAALGFGSGGEPAIDAHVVLGLRLPRVVLAIVAGASLAVCGALMQGLFRNPLADPALLGVSGGAALGASLAMVCAPLLPAALQLVGPPVAAFVGGVGVAVLVMRLGGRRSAVDTGSLLLCGVALQAFMAAATGLVLFFADDAALRSITSWFLGGLGGVEWKQLALVVPVELLALSLALTRGRALDVLLLGEAEALHLGVPVARLERQLVLLTTLLAASAVAITGVIGFIGLVVPHVVRLLLGPVHARLLPLSALLGAVLLLLADTFARTLVPHQELPVGILTAACGAPFFLWLVARQRGLGGVA